MTNQPVMTLHRALLTFLSLGALPAWAVYAPIPESDQGKAWSVKLSAGAYHDSNIFGASSGEIDSMVYSVSSLLAVNASVTARTFVSASYKLSLDRIEDRPGDNTLDSHDLSLRQRPPHRARAQFLHGQVEQLLAERLPVRSAALERHDLRTHVDGSDPHLEIPERA